MSAPTTCSTLDWSYSADREGLPLPCIRYAKGRCTRCSCHHTQVKIPHAQCHGTWFGKHTDHQNPNCCESPHPVLTVSCSTTCLSAPGKNTVLTTSLTTGNRTEFSTVKCSGKETFLKASPAGLHTNASFLLSNPTDGTVNAYFVLSSWPRIGF